MARRITVRNYSPFDTLVYRGSRVIGTVHKTPDGLYLALAAKIPGQRRTVLATVTLFNSAVEAVVTA